MRRLWLGLALWLAVGAAQAADLVAGVRERLAQPALLRGDFTQSKSVAGFRKPLASNGDFLVSRERGVLWHTRKPFAGELRMTRNEIVATQDGRVAFQLDAGREPSVRVINNLMFSLLGGDVLALKEYFTIDGKLSGKSWSLTLTPRHAALAKSMRRVDLSGDRYVRQITIDESNGDSTHIQFSALRRPPPALTAEEAARFD